MTEFLILLLMQVTVFSSVTAFIIIAVKQIFKCRIPPFIGMIMWVVLLARLVCPIFPESRLSVYNLIPVGREIMYSLTNDIGDELESYESEKSIEENPYVIVTAREAQQAIENSEKITEEKESPVTIGEYLINDIGEEAHDNANKINLYVLWVYAVGAALCVTVNTFVYVYAKKKVLKQSFPYTDTELLQIYKLTAAKLKISDKNLPQLRIGDNAMLAGCVKSSVICRDDMSEMEARCVFAHELSHYKHNDNFMIIFSSYVACMFWYNPLIWIVKKMLRNDVEVLCDYRTIDYFEMSAAVYAKMICRHSLYNETADAGCNMSATGRSLKARLRSISHKKNKKFISRTASFALCAVMIAVCLTNPIISQNSDYDAYIENFSADSGVSERVLQLSDRVIVSDYLENAAVLIEKKMSAEHRQKIGNGSLEKFKRTVANSGYFEAEIVNSVSGLRSDDILTVESCAVINYCIAYLITDGNINTQNISLSLLPEYISVEKMNGVLSGLTSTEAESLLMCYNKGVEGADVTFQRYYTSSMMKLILQRINDDWSRRKFYEFYTEIDSSAFAAGGYSADIVNIDSLIKNNSSFYVLDSDVTAVEETSLRNILGAAIAGQRSDVYYLKDREDGCTAEIAEVLFGKSGYTAEKMLSEYSEIGETTYTYLTKEKCAVLSRSRLNSIEKRLSGTSYSVFDYFERLTDENGDYIAYFALSDENGIENVLSILNSMTYAELRDDTPIIVGLHDGEISSAIEKVYSLGLIDSTDGVIDPHQIVSSGESIMYAYRIIAYAVNLY
jgi:beta-lactamase regulating signal transducer with metallopeptidase domain